MVDLEPATVRVSNHRRKSRVWGPHSKRRQAFLDFVRDNNVDFVCFNPYDARHYPYDCSPMDTMMFFYYPRGSDRFHVVKLDIEGRVVHHVGANQDNTAMVSLVNR